ncbi:MAG: hypothetical protein ABJN57_09440 [Hyphomicrobiales bacterium]
MTETQDKQGIREEFTSKGFDVTRLHAAFITATKLFEDNQDHSKSLQALMSDVKGLDLANLLGGRRALTSAAATMQTSTAAEKRAKQDAEDWAFYLTLMQDGQVGHYIANEIFDNKSDWEIFQIVAEIETATGDSFENYAKSILGVDNVPEVLEGESDADYQRRVLKAITAEILDPRTGQIKPQYADDPVAKIIRDHKAYQHTVAKTVEIENRLNRGDITLKEAKQEVQEDSQDQFSVGDVHASTAENGEVIKTAKETQNVIRDEKVYSAALQSESDDFFGDAFVTDNKIAQVSEAAKLKFNTKSQDHVSTDRSDKPSIDLEVKLT